MFQISKTTREILYVRSMLQDVTEEIKKQAEQRVSSPSIMYVPGVHKLALENTQWNRRYGHSAEPQKPKTGRD